MAFFLLAELCSIVYVYLSLFAPSSVHGHLDCFHVLTIVNSAAVNTGGLHLFEFSLDKCPVMGLQDHTVTLFFFKEPPYCSP